MTKILADNEYIKKSYIGGRKGLRKARQEVTKESHFIRFIHSGG
jgi:hypothetical protein